MKNFFLPVLCLAIATSFGCKSYKPVISVPAPESYPSTKPSQMMAGIAQKDLTLPPGYPMSGYSINGRISRGYWIRPKATALYLQDTAGTPFVFVTTDLWAITDGQKMAVLKALSEDPDTWFISESELLLCATHTHHSSGVIELDKAFASTSIGFGIDKAAFGFTVRQIVSAIKESIRCAEPATVSYAVDSVRGIAKNRSKVPYFANTETERQAYFQGQPEKEIFYRTEEEEGSSIEKGLSVITVKNSKGQINGILASYPMHPTATGDATEVYSADVFGLAAAKVRVSGKLSDSVIVAFYNGAEGDVAPDYRFHQRYDAVRIADSLSEAIITLSQSGNPILLNDEMISHRTKTINIASNSTTLENTDNDCYEQQSMFVKTAKVPVVGAAVLAGASDGRTSLSSFGISDGIRIPRKEWESKQGYKMPAVRFLTENVWGHLIPQWAANAAKRNVKISPKSKLTISIHKVGPVYFAGLPGEFTTMMGRRIKKAIAAEFNIKDHLISLVGLADAYVSYITTPCEYEKQFYEGASNFFGISTGPVFVKEYRQLARNKKNEMNERKGRKTRFKAGKVVSFGPKYLGNLQVWNAEEGLHNLLVSAEGYRVNSKSIPPFGQARGIMDVDSNSIVAFSFDDQVNTIDSANFYPNIIIRKSDGIISVLPEHILSVDEYKIEKSKWTVRILNTSSFADGIPRQIVVTSLSGTTLPPSGFFRIRQSGVR